VDGSKQQKFTFSQLLRSGVWGQGVRRLTLPLIDCAETFLASSWLLVTALHPWHSSACSCATPSLPLLLLCSLCVYSCDSCGDSSRLDWGPPYSSMTSSSQITAAITVFPKEVTFWVLGLGFQRVWEDRHD
jgi:hypothetical protein